MRVTRKVFDAFKPGEPFKIVITRIQNVILPMEATIKFIAKKGDSGLDWAIYYGHPEMDDKTIMTRGDKVHGEETIQSIMPCDAEVFDLYRN